MAIIAVTASAAFSTCGRRDPMQTMMARSETSQIHARSRNAAIRG